MKSLRIQSHDSRGKEFKNKHSLRHTDATNKGRPTPLDFDAFIPWFCLELQVPKNVIVTKMNQVEYVRYGSKISKETSKSKSKSRSTKIKSSSIKSGSTNNQTILLSKQPVTPVGHCQDAVHVKTFCDKRGRLVEIAIVECCFPIPPKVIQAINICLPFHLELSKLCIQKGGLSDRVLYEIGKLLPHSNITDVCLDDSYVPEGNYSVLLERPSQIKYLSLKRCGINDAECKNIADKLDVKDAACKHLSILDLSCNKIGNEGAKAVGESLKSNRFLKCLNLSGNNISDIGAAYILKYLKEFQLGFDDIKGKWYRRWNYLKSKKTTYEKCLEEATLNRLNFNEKNSSVLNSGLFSSKTKKPKSKKPSFVFEDLSVDDIAEKMTKEIIGEFDDPFKEENIKYKDNLVYAIGNFTLCSLNLAYNNLTLLSVKKILNILTYQRGINKTINCTGLLRVVIDGNSIPYQSIELDEIDSYLKRALTENEHLSVLSFNTPFISSSTKFK